MLLAPLIDVHGALDGQAPAFDELIEAQRTLDDENRALDDQSTVRGERILEHRGFDASTAVIEREDDAAATLVERDALARRR